MTFRSTSERRNSSDTERDITTLAESTINDLLDRIKCTTESTTLLNETGETTLDTTRDTTRDTTCDSVTITRDTDSEKTSQCVTERDLTSVTRDGQLVTQNGDKVVTISEGTSTDNPPRLDQDTLSRIDSVRKESNSEGENLVRSISKTDCQIFNELEKMGKCLKNDNFAPSFQLVPPVRRI